jgi:UDP-N-acetylmuramate--alanine ligase
MNLDTLKQAGIHFVGIGGSGMSGLARIALLMGIKTSGSDAKDSKTLQDLAGLGAEIYRGHDSANISGKPILVVSSAISKENAEVLRAQELGLPIISRAQALSLFMEGKKSIAIAGTHGKTTTTSMLTVALQTLGLDPSFAIGGTINRGGTNAHYGSGSFFIAEADESDGSLLTYKPSGAVITNIELDHVDNFPDIESIKDVFQKFINSIQPDGFLVAGVDSPYLRELIAANKRSDLNVITYGCADADLVYSHLALSPNGGFARIAYKGKILGELETVVPGEHNVLNALAVIGTGIALNLPSTEVISGIKNFTGARRRFELKGRVKGISVVDDYGHHPTEIEVTLKAAKNFAGTGKVRIIFQPHRYSRTAAFTEEFAKALALADQVYLLEVYGAGENPIPGVTSKSIADLIPGAIYNPSMIEVVGDIVKNSNPGDLIMTLGAGDVSALAPAILDNLNAN